MRIDGSSRQELTIQWRTTVVGGISIHDSETDSPFLILHRRDSAGFRREILSGPEAILTLPEAGITIPLAELYSDVS